MKKNRIWRIVKVIFWKLARGCDSKEQIAWGAAIGTFISVFPTFGLGTPMVLVLGRFFKFNMFIALATSVISNPFTGPFFLLSSYKVGTFVLNVHPNFNLENWASNLKDTGLIIFTGSLIVSGIMSLLAYFISLFMVEKYRNLKN